MRASAKATSEPCSNPSRPIRSAAASFPPRKPEGGLPQLDSGPWRPGQTIATGPRRPAGRNLRTGGEQGGLLRPGRLLPSPPPANRLVEFRRPAAAARLRPDRAERGGRFAVARAEGAGQRLSRAALLAAGLA